MGDGGLFNNDMIVLVRSHRPTDVPLWSVKMLTHNCCFLHKIAEEAKIRIFVFLLIYLCLKVSLYYWLGTVETLVLNQRQSMTAEGDETCQHENFPINIL